MPTTTDRLSQLRSRAEDFTGVEFVQVVDKCDQRVLRIYFLTDTLALRPPFEPVADPVVPGPLTPGDIRIYSPRGEAPDVLLDPDPAHMQWAEDAAASRRYLEIVVQQPGSFTDYRLKIDDARIDRVYNDVAFSFKVGCDDDLDCAEPEAECTPPEPVDFPVDYLARDFVSLRNALLDFAAQRYPNWQLPKEADVGVMFLEVMAALGDELSYVQDRMNREAYLETATERRSLRHKARLVDHEIHDGRMASTVLELTVADGTVSVTGGATVWALVEGGAPIAFEIGNGMKDRGVNFAVNALWNPGNFTPYSFDDDHACLEPGATSLYVRNDPAGLDNPSGALFDAAAASLWSEGRLLLLRDKAADASEIERLHLVHVTEVELIEDELFGIALACIRWDEQDALPFHLPLEDLELSGNLVPATAGEARTASFRLGPLEDADPDGVLQAVERQGPLYSDADPSLLERRDPCEDKTIDPSARSPVYLLSLPGTDEQGLAFADPLDDLRATVPELLVYPDGEADDPWDFQRSLLLCDGDEQVYTLEDGTWWRIASYWRSGEEYVHRDYASGAGYTIRFGDGEFGRLPPRDALFHVEYRLGSGTLANLPVGAVSALSIPNQSPPHVGPLVGLVEAVRNPFPISSGVDPETSSQIKLLTPEAYQAETLFAVRPEDYGAQAEKLDFVQRAQGTFRWTGSWLSATTAIDPVGAFELSSERREIVENLLNCRRQAGRDVIIADPKYVNLDLRITVCVDRASFPAQVKVRVLDALFGRLGPPRLRGFFDPDNFTFGTPLRRAALEAKIVAVGGVEAVMGMEIRIHGVTDFEPFDSLTFEVAADQLIRLENLRLHPERGSLSLTMAGGA
jgi:hypothetical protein